MTITTQRPFTDTILDVKLSTNLPHLSLQENIKTVLCLPLNRISSTIEKEKLTVMFELKLASH